MKSAINMAWEHGGADFQSRFDKSTGQAQRWKRGRCAFCRNFPFGENRPILGEGFRGSEFHTKPTLTCLLIQTPWNACSLKFQALLPGTRLANSKAR